MHVVLFLFILNQIPILNCYILFIYVLIDLFVIIIWDSGAPSSILGDNIFFHGVLYQNDVENFAQIFFHGVLYQNDVENFAQVSSQYTESVMKREAAYLRWAGGGAQRLFLQVLTSIKRLLRAAHGHVDGPKPH
jgi:hypothetical protein